MATMRPPVAANGWPTPECADSPARAVRACFRAATTGGRYFRARDANALQAIYQQIDALERAPVQTRSYVRYTERFRWPLALALGALALEAILLAWRGPLP